jgi:NAD(P)-dependent dehydrogenase (short-subunit alcohol dehydrogenase family)
MIKKIILITGASSGFGRLTAEALAKAGNTVYASMRDIAGRNAKNAAEMAETSKRDGVDLRAIELDVQSEPSIDVAVKKIMAESGKIDVLVHNAGHMMFGPAEAFLPEQFALQYDVNVLGTQRVNRAVLPHMPRETSASRISSSSAGGTPPFRALFRGQSGDGLAGVLSARELSRWGIGRRSSCRARSPRARTTSRIPGVRLTRRGSRNMKLAPTGPGEVLPSPRSSDAEPAAWRRDRQGRRLPFGKRPFQIHYDPTETAPMSAYRARPPARGDASSGRPLRPARPCLVF